MKPIIKPLIAILLTLCSLSSCTYIHTDRVNCELVTGKERVNNKAGGYYLVFTDKGEYTVSDEFFRGNFKSSTWYGSLDVGKLYSFKTGGFRLPFFSKYPNIISQPKNCDQ